MKKMIHRLTFVFLPPLILVFSLKAIIEARQQQPPPVPVVNEAIDALKKMLLDHAGRDATTKAEREQAVNDEIKKLVEAMQPPVDQKCDWKLKQEGTFGQCELINGSWIERRFDLYTYDEVSPASHGGALCSPPAGTPKTEPFDRPCQPPAGGVLIQQTDLVWEGAFRLQSIYDPEAIRTFGWGGTAIAHLPSENALLVVAHDWHQWTGKVSIPTKLGTGPTVGSLPVASTLGWADVTQGKLGTVDGSTSSGVKVGGQLPLANGQLVVTGWRYYDNGAQRLTHFLSKTNLASLIPADVTGPFQVGVGTKDSAGNQRGNIGGLVSGYMAPIPQAYQSALGGTHLTGQGGGVSILARTSAGPSATVFTPADLGVKATGKLVMGYPIDHQTLGQWGVNGGLYNGTQAFRGMVFPDGTRSILFFGWGGTDFCYGAGTADPTLHKKVNPANGVMWCYDPVDLNKGTHGYPNRSLVFAYNVDDFIAVAQGLKLAWDLKPYATWTFSLPFQQKLVNGVDMGDYSIVGAAYDPATKRLYLSAFRQDGDNPLMHVLLCKVCQ